MSKWFEKMHPIERADHALKEILTRTGIGAQIDAELEAERAARFRELAERKGNVLNRFTRDRDNCGALVTAAERKQKAAQKAAEDALQEYIRARDALSTCHDTVKYELEQIEPLMLQCFDPRIAEFRRELDETLAASETHYRIWPDPEGSLQGIGGGRMAHNRAAVDRRARFLLELIGEVDRLRVRHDIGDIGTEIARLRNSIPDA